MVISYYVVAWIYAILRLVHFTVLGGGTVHCVRLPERLKYEVKERNRPFFSKAPGEWHPLILVLGHSNNRSSCTSS